MDKETCKKCGSVYELKYTRLIARDKDSIECEVCNEPKLHVWNEAKTWDAILIEKKLNHLKK